METNLLQLEESLRAAAKIKSTKSPTASHGKENRKTNRNINRNKTDTRAESKQDSRERKRLMRSISAMENEIGIYQETYSFFKNEVMVDSFKTFQDEFSSRSFWILNFDPHFIFHIKFRLGILTAPIVPGRDNSILTPRADAPTFEMRRLHADVTAPPLPLMQCRAERKQLERVNEVLEEKIRNLQREQQADVLLPQGNSSLRVV